MSRIHTYVTKSRRASLINAYEFETEGWGLEADEHTEEHLYLINFIIATPNYSDSTRLI
jgi:hypothetical protein